MSSLNNEEKAKKIALLAAKALDEKKAKDIKILYVNKQTIIADYFVIAAGTSRTQVNALADEVEYKLGLEDIQPTKIEGRGQGTWVLLDYDSVLVHVFNPQSREFYNLEKLWADGEEIPFEMTED
ncbi:MAG: ribosome silencing factor [Ruminococcaceae bacterium]|nr:ribosome silencing factor [Oscillospiraceae bacterium]